MRVLMVSKALVTGVYQKKLEELAKLPGVELLAIAPPYWHERRVGDQPFERRFDCGYDLAVEPMTFNGHHHIHFYRGLAAQFRRFQPEIVHIDEEPINAVAAHCTLLARRARAKTVFFTWQNIDRNYPPPFSIFRGMTFRAAGVAIAGNQDALRILQRRGFRKPVAVIPQFGIDPSIYRPAPRAMRAMRVPTVGYYGRVVSEKGLDTLIEAVARLPEKPRVVIVGSGSARGELERLAARRGLREHVEFRPPVPAEQVPALLAELDVSVLPSRTRRNWKEQFGRTLVESMACEVPVIGSDSGEIPHVIGEAGLVFPEGDADALAERISRVLNDRHLAHRLGQAGRARVLQQYTQAQVAAATYAVYERVLYG